jgi:hypothetical protein
MTAPGEGSVPEIEDDESIPPLPEAEAADVPRAKPDIANHAQHLEE